MTTDAELPAGLEPGLRFAVLLCHDGSVRDLRWQEVRDWLPEQGFLWVHLERDDPVAQDWVRGRAGLDPLLALSLLTEDARPRVEDFDDGLLVVLRGVDKSATDDATGLVPIHIWVDARRCLTLRDKAHSIAALRDLRVGLMVGRGPRTPGGLLSHIAERVIDHVGTLIEEMEDGVSALEDRMGEVGGASDLRLEISAARRQAVQLRRYLAPQREAFYRLQHDDAPWLDIESKLRLREVNDRLTRHLEDIDELRHRATILNEDFTNMLAERSAQASNRLTALAALVLPPSLIAGLLGTNIGGIPGAQEPLAFVWLCVLVLGMMPLSWLVLRLLKWL